MIEILLSIIAGLVLLLFAVNKLSESIHSIIGDKANSWIQKFTSNTFSSLYHLDSRISPKDNDQIINSVIPKDNNWPPLERRPIGRGKLFFLSVLLVGIVVTTLLHSSSAVIVLSP
jgi:hypothetical protein